MPSNIRVGQKIRVTVRFADFDFSSGTDELIGPISVTGSIYKYNLSLQAYELIGSMDTITQDSLGIYHYDWTTSEDGKFKLVFAGTLVNATPSVIYNNRVFYVGTEEPVVVLNSALEYTFLGELSPLYLDPERIKDFFPEADLVEVTEIIYRLSLELEQWFGTNLTMTNLYEQYLIAATLCELSKTYLIDGGMNGFGKTDSFSLGDLTINNGFGGGSSTKKNIYPGNVTSWCELAFVLKAEMTKSKTTYRPIVKGSNFDNPIPSRGLRNFD
jgi:hypothetical protein